MTSIKTGKYDVLYSGTFIAGKKDTSEITFIRGKEKITLELHFEGIKKEAYFSSEGESHGDSVKVIVTLPPSTNQIGEGMTELYNFANYDNGDELYLILWTSSLNEAYQEIKYTIYLDKKKKTKAVKKQ